MYRGRIDRISKVGKKGYNVPTSDATVTTIDRDVERQTLKEIANGIDPMMVECHSIFCEGKTKWSVLPGEIRQCPKCDSTVHAYPLGTYEAPVDLDADTQYGDKAYDAKAPKAPNGDRKNGRDESGCRKGFDHHAMRAKICADATDQNGMSRSWDFAACCRIFNVGETILTEEYFAELRAKYGPKLSLA